MASLVRPYNLQRFTTLNTHLKFGSLESPASPMMKEAMILGSRTFIARLLSVPSIPGILMLNVVNYFRRPNSPW